MGKNYQIPLCKKCWKINYSRNAVECTLFDNIFAHKPYTKETAQKPRLHYRENISPMIDYEKNKCGFFIPTKSREGKGRELKAEDRRKMAIEAKRNPLHGSTPGGGHW